MRGRLPGMTGEAPPGYVVFVARHLEPLRREAVRATGDEAVADRLYPDVLSDVARRWAYLELLGAVLRRPDVADRYLRIALDRRCRRATAPDRDGPPPGSDIAVFGPGAPSSGTAPADPPSPPAAVAATWEPSPPAPGVARDRLSTAARRARVMRSAGTPAGPSAEAAIAWWHAYESRRRRVTVAALVGCVLLALIVRHAAPAG